jgi:hypothetical protein
MIEENQSTFTSDRVWKIVQENLIEVDGKVQSDNGGLSESPRWRRQWQTWLRVRETEFENVAGGDMHVYGSRKRKERALTWCKAYVDQCMDPESHLERIDHVHGELV